MDDFMEVGIFVGIIDLYGNLWLFCSAIYMFQVVFYCPYLGSEDVGSARKDGIEVGALTSQFDSVGWIVRRQLWIRGGILFGTNGF